MGSLLLFLVGWQMVAERNRPPADSQQGAPLGHVLRSSGPRQEKLVVHLSVWGFYAGLIVSFGFLRVALEPGWWLLAGVPAIFVFFLLGRSAARRRSFPAWLRWILAPYHGLAIWFLLLGQFARRIAGRAGRAKEGSGTPAAGTYRSSVRELQDLSAEEMLIPRSQVVSVRADTTLHEALAVIIRHPHKLMPVMQDGADEPLGVARLIDLAHPDEPERRVTEVVTQAPIVPETMRGIDLLRRLSDGPPGAALVVDEFGSHAGFVTLEDVFEVLAGELIGEHEVVFKRILPETRGVFRVEGACRIEEFNEQVGPVLPAGEYETVAGLFLDRVGRIPQLGDDLELPEAKMEVLDRTDRRILWVRIEVPRLQTREASG